MNAFNHHRRFAYRDSLEAFNRASHSDALPEMQLIPAETIQPLPLTGYRPHWGLYLGAAALAFVLTVVGVS